MNWMNFEQKIKKKEFVSYLDTDYNDMKESSVLKCHLFFAVIDISPFRWQSLISFSLSLWV